MYRSVVWIDWSSSKCVFTYIFSRLFFFLCLWNKWLRSIGLVIGPTLSSFLHSSGFLGRQNSDRLVHHRTHLVFLHPFISSSDRPAQTSIDIECLFSFIHQAPAGRPKQASTESVYSHSFIRLLLHRLPFRDFAAAPLMRRVCIPPAKRQHSETRHIYIFDQNSLSVIDNTCFPPS